MMKDVLDYELSKEEQFLIRTIQYAVIADEEMAEAFNKAVSPLMIYINFGEKNSIKSADYQREIHFPELLAMAERAVMKCYDEIDRVLALQDEQEPEIECGVEMAQKMNVKRVLQTAEYEFYDALVRLCKNKKF